MHTIDSTGPTRVQRVAAILWPSFLSAGVITTVVFAVADPSQVISVLNRTSVYSLGFFFFWLISAGACWGTAYILKPVPRRITEFRHSTQNDVDDLI